MKVAVIIPAYNAAGGIAKLLEQTVKQADAGEIIVIDDGSTDGTSDVVGKFPVRLLNHPVNYGKGAALKTGFEHALTLGCDAVITLDADGQHDPKYVPDLKDIFQAGHYDIVVGSRRNNFDMMSFARFLSNNITTVVVSLLAGRKIKDSQCGYRIISRKVLTSVTLESSGYQAESELLIKAGRQGFGIGHIPIEVKSSATSHIRHLADTLKFITMSLKTLWI